MQRGNFLGEKQSKNTHEQHEVKQNNSNIVIINKYII